jgi:hypothetical protein
MRAEAGFPAKLSTCGILPPTFVRVCA